MTGLYPGGGVGFMGTGYCTGFVGRTLSSVEGPGFEFLRRGMVDGLPVLPTRRSSLRSDFPVLPRPRGRRHPSRVGWRRIPRTPFGSHRRLHGRPGTPSTTPLRPSRFPRCGGKGKGCSVALTAKHKFAPNTGEQGIDRCRGGGGIFPTRYHSDFADPPYKKRAGVQMGMQPWRRRWLPKGSRGIRSHPTLLGCERPAVRGRTGKSDRREDRRVGRIPICTPARSHIRKSCAPVNEADQPSSTSGPSFFTCFTRSSRLIPIHIDSAAATNTDE